MEEIYDVAETGGALSPIGDDLLVAAARMAEERIDAVIKIKQMALKVTNPSDWTDQNGNPYLQVSGAEKVANLYSVSWKISEPTIEYEESGHFTYTYHGVFTMMGRSIEVEGSRSSKDPFFKKYNWIKEAGKPDRKEEKPITEMDKRDVKMAAMTNLLGNGITRILGIRSLTWDDLEKFAGITQAMVKNKINYKKEGGADDKKEPPTVARKSQGAKQQGGAETDKIHQAQLRAIYPMLKTLGVGEDQKHIFCAKTLGLKSLKTLNDLTHEQGEELIAKLMAEGRTPQAENNPTTPEGWTDPAECTHDPQSCPNSGWMEGIAYCGPDGEKCPYSKGE